MPEYQQYQDDPSFQAAQLGLEASDFFTSKIGRYVLQRSADTRADALEALADVCPSDEDAIRRLQTKAVAAEQCIRWLREAIEAGRLAEQQIAEEDSYV